MRTSWKLLGTKKTWGDSMKQATSQRILVSITSTPSHYDLNVLNVWNLWQVKGTNRFCLTLGRLGWLQDGSSAPLPVSIFAHGRYGASPTRRWEAQSQHCYFCHGYGLPWTASDSFGNTTEEVCNEASNWCLATIQNELEGWASGTWGMT